MKSVGGLSSAHPGCAGLTLGCGVAEGPDGLDLNRSETATGPWDYPPTAKLERLLRHCRVAAGVLTNGRVLRLLVAPHGESSGWITFRVADMATVGGRPILDALVYTQASVPRRGTIRQPDGTPPGCRYKEML